MSDLQKFREKVTIYRKRKDTREGRPHTQAELAKAIGLSEDELGHRLHENGRVPLTQKNIFAIVLTLAAWETLTWEEAIELLTCMDYPLDPPDWKTKLQPYLSPPAQSVQDISVTDANALRKKTASPQGSDALSAQERTLYLQHVIQPNQWLNPDPDREARLIEALASSDRFEIKRTIDALGRFGSGWVVKKLTQILQGQDEELAKTSASALEKIPGARSAEALAVGFSSPLSEVRAWCAYTAGEMALFRRRDDVVKIVSQLAPLAYDSSPRVSQESVHALGKIGGSIAISRLIDVLASSATSVKLKAYALHGSRWWSHQEVMSFVSSISQIVRTYTDEQCNQILQEGQLQSAPSEVISLLRLPRLASSEGFSADSRTD